MIDMNLARLDAQQVERAARAIATCGFCVCRSGLADKYIHDAAREARALYAARKMQPAFFGGAGEAGRVESERRQDHNLWLHTYVTATGSNDAIAAGAGTLGAIDKLVADAGRAVLEQLSSFSSSSSSPPPPFARGDRGEVFHCTGRSDGMVAVYPGGHASYGAHLDNVDGDGRDDYGRVLTLVYYLNPTWDVARDGGALRVYAPWQPAKPAAAMAAVPQDALANELAAYDVAPLGGTLAIFRADQIVHEVRPSLGERAALTVWLHGGTEKQAKAAGFM